MAQQKPKGGVPHRPAEGPKPPTQQPTTPQGGKGTGVIPSTTPAVARSRRGPAAAQGHGGGPK